MERLPSDDSARMSRQSTQWAILHSDWETDDIVVKDFMARVISKERLAMWGPPDTSGNILANAARQLSTGGLYDRPPKVTHEKDVADFLAIVAKCGLWRTGQERSRKAIGMGDCILAVGWNKRTKSPSLRFVRPQDTVVRVDKEDPTRAIEFAEIGIRRIDGKPVYCWDVFSIEDEADPWFKVFRADRATEGEPYGELVPEHTRAGRGGPKGYGWFAEDGSPRIPRVRYAILDTLTYWHDLWVRDAARGTMFAIVLWTFTHHCARDATGSTVICTDIEPPVGSVENAGQTTRSVSVQMEPGSAWFLRSSSDSQKQPTVNTIGPGVNLPHLQTLAIAYEAKQCERLGVSSAEVQRTSGDPTSGAALAITKEGRREFSRAIVPMFLDADTEALELIAIACNEWGNMDVPETGYTVTYDIPPESPQAQAERREQQTWDLANGQKSSVDVYVANNPGALPADAERELIRVGKAQARLRAAIGEDEPDTETANGEEPGPDSTTSTQPEE